LLWKDRTPEEIEKIIEKTAEFIVKHELEDPAILFFESIKPVAPVGGRLGGAAFAWLIPFIGHGIDDYFVVFREPENIEKLLKMIEDKRQVIIQNREKEKKSNNKKIYKFWRRSS